MAFFLRVTIILLAFWVTGGVGTDVLTPAGHVTQPVVYAAESATDTQDSATWKDYLAGKRRLRIGLVMGANEVQLACDGPFRVTQNGTIRDCQPTDVFTASDVTRQPVRLAPTSPSAVWSIHINGKTLPGCYTGPMEVFTAPSAPDTKSRLTLVNEPPLEHYIEGVVAKEVGASFSMEALRAQAIAARSYTLRYIGRHKADGFDLCASTDCQVFEGDASRFSRIHTAVFSTRGQVLVYNDQPIKALYCSTCGGETAVGEMVSLNVNECPYLSGCSDEPTPRPRLSSEDKIAAALAEHSTSYCKIAPARVYRWKETFTATQIDTFIGMNLGKLIGQPQLKPGKVKSMRVSSRSGSRASTLEVACESGIYEVKGNDIRWLFGKGKPNGLRSTFFVLSTTGDPQGNPLSYTFTGGGWGHGVGMCQWGAQGRARAGQTAQEILRAYYPGTRLWTAELTTGSE